MLRLSIDTQILTIHIKNPQEHFFSDSVYCSDSFLVFWCFFVIMLSPRDDMVADTQMHRWILSVMPTSQLFEVEVGCTDPPPPRRISKLSRSYRNLKKNTPVIPVDANHPAASAAHRTVGERQHAPTRSKDQGNYGDA